jgi:hypothetical protein
MRGDFQLIATQLLTAHTALFAPFFHNVLFFGNDTVKLFGKYFQWRSEQFKRDARRFPTNFIRISSCESPSKIPCHLIANSAHNTFCAFFYIIQILEMTVRNSFENISNSAVNNLGKGAKNAPRCCKVHEDAFSTVAISTDTPCFLNAYNAVNLLCPIGN